KVAGEVVKIPGGSGMSSTFTPSIYINMDYLDSTGLVQYGSRVNYHRYFKTSSEKETDRFADKLEPELKKYGHRLETVEGRKESLGKGFQNLYKFFNLLAFIALVLGCIGIASSVYIYAREKRDSVAVLRCMGASGWQSFNVYLIQTVVTGLIGSIIGVLLGLFIQFGLPKLLEEFIPMTLTMHVSWFVVVEGLGLGFAISVLFSVLPLLSIRFVPPLSVLRTAVDNRIRISKTGVAVSTLTVLFPLAFASYQSGSLVMGSWFFAGLLTAFVSLALIARLLMYLVRRYFPAGLGFIWKQSLANLFRPNNQTTVMMVVIGLGAFLVATLYIVQTSLLNQVEFADQENKSNTILFDVQPHQREGIIGLTRSNGLPVQQVVPIVTCRLASINGKTIEAIQQDTTDGIPNWALTREYRVTYRDSLHPSEKLIEGELQVIDKQKGSDSIRVTLSEGMQENLEVKVGDSVTFDVQGVPVKVVIGGIRDVEWPRDPPNFIFVFPSGVLEEAPQVYVLTTRVDAKTVADKYSRELVALFPNVSLIDLRLILSTIQEFFDKVSFVIKFMALFSIITGLIVLAGAVINSKYARLKENVLLRTVGAMQKQIVGLTLLEYSYLGFFAGLTGILLSLLSGYGLSLFLFEVIFLPDISGLFVIWLGVILLTVSVGWFNTRSILNKSPLEVLRKQ
ncbi:MAG: FtsX-like permease family protein, partial [Cyclobacteriaceae bacterium]|nr:FtsX-like permease family protein [Cyclobacteriaceae bacterium]